jgi:hypothetical protein
MDDIDERFYADANRYAGKMTGLAKELTERRDIHNEAQLIAALRQKYKMLFDAYVAGATCGAWKERERIEKLAAEKRQGKIL